MVALNLQHVYDAQAYLKSAGIKCVVTGDVGLAYHGVDVAIFNLELCVPDVDRVHAAKLLQARKTQYRTLPDLDDPDFYHPYKKGASRCQIRSISPTFELHIVSDKALGMNLDAIDCEESKADTSQMHPEIRGLCHGVSNEVLSSITWTRLSAFVNGWLQLAVLHHGEETQLVFLMEAERLMDASRIDQTWCMKHIDDEERLSIATQLVRKND
ncbi:hypothetical protein KVT40_000563 [Elsinoe batatas]|uniref:Uncharacterized protein n=1 Tax=Elsinoe batatas TaxID=2601811 RepID=A0A8K0PL87_9PEZI|nr:hypothetical protein KVT40_000563 [Elsinoe batatas]